MNKTAIEWTDYTWNPVSGCRHGCPYCYAKRMADRFSGDARMNIASAERWNGQEGLYVLDKPFPAPKERALHFPYGFEPTLFTFRMDWPQKIKQGANIFVCSMADLFGDWVPDEWISMVFEAAKAAPQNNYLFLTKNPERYNMMEALGKLPVLDNFWYGVSATNSAQLERAVRAIAPLPGAVKTFLSAEPLWEDLTSSEWWKRSDNGRYFDWVIVGAETGNRRGKVAPERDWVEALAADCKNLNIPVFMKDSLSQLMGSDLIQEFPAGLKHEKRLTAKQRARLLDRCGFCKVEQPKKSMVAILARFARGQQPAGYGYLCPDCFDLFSQAIKGEKPVVVEEVE